MTLSISDYKRLIINERNYLTTLRKSQNKNPLPIIAEMIASSEYYISQYELILSNHEKKQLENEQIGNDGTKKIIDISQNNDNAGKVRTPRRKRSNNLLLESNTIKQDSEKMCQID